MLFYMNPKLAQKLVGRMFLMLKALILGHLDKQDNIEKWTNIVYTSPFLGTN